MTEGTDSVIGYLTDDTTASTANTNISGDVVRVDDDGDVRTFDADDVTLTVDDSGADPIDRRDVLDAADQEFEMSLELELEADPVVCPHCSELNQVPVTWLHFLDEDQPCQACGFPLQVVR